MLTISGIYLYGLLFIFGATVGSFLNVVIDRFATKRDIMWGRSICESCKKTLHWHELIPLISFLFLKGKCSTCKKRIPQRIFIVEFITALGFVLIYTYGLQLGISLTQALFILVLFSIFVALFFIDFSYGILPDKLIFALIVITVPYLLLSSLPLLGHVLSGVASLLFFLLLFVITKGRGMGFGDVKLSFALGFLLGYPFIIVSLYLAFLTGATVSIILVLWGRKSFKKGVIPFGPFLVLSTFSAFLFGDKIIAFALSLF